MLEQIRDWAMTVAGIVILGSVCGLLLPSGSFQKYVRLAVGLILILALTAPLQRLLRMDIPAEWEAAGRTEAYSQRAGLEAQQQTQVIALYRQKLGQKLLASLQGRLGSEICRVECQVEEGDPARFGALTQVTVFTQAEPDSGQTARIAEILKDEYGVAEGLVTVQRLKER